MDLTKINVLSEEDFVIKFKNVVEKFEPCAIYLNSARPFQSTQAILDASADFFETLAQRDIEDILILHPDLAGKISDETYLTNESVGEQRAAGLRDISLHDTQLLKSMNELYKEKFGFPFIICARENKFQSILGGLKARLNNERDQEMRIAIGEVKKITFHRIKDLLL